MSGLLKNVESELPGLAEAIISHWQDQNKAAESFVVHGLELGRLVCEFAARDEVCELVESVNESAKSSIGGRPREPHTWVCEKLVSLPDYCGPTLLHLQRCARAYAKAARLALPAQTSLRSVEAVARTPRARDAGRVDAVVEVVVESVRRIEMIEPDTRCFFIPLTPDEVAALECKLQSPCWRIVVRRPVA